MIVDSIKELHRYSNILPFANEMLTLYRSVMDDRGNFKAGKYNLEDTDLHYLVLEYNLKEEEKGLWEAHRKYYDIHVICDGIETIHIADLREMTPINDYNADADYQLFEGRKTSELILQNNVFIIFFPEDVHKTGIGVEDSKVKKLVFKAPILQNKTS